MNKELIIFNPSIEDGGVEKNLFLITNFLSSININTSIISADLNKKKEFTKNVKFLYPKKVDFKNSSRYKKYFFCLLLLTKEILKNKTKHVFSFQANIYCIIICKLLGAKVIVRMNTSPQGWDHSKFKNIIYNYFIKKADGIIVNSKTFQREVKKRYGVKSKFINNPFNFKKIEKLSKKKSSFFFPKDSIKLVTMGRLTEQKSQITILKSLNILKEKKIKFFLYIIGKGHLKNKLLKYVKINNLSKYIKFIGYQKNPFNIIKKAEIFILSSLYEGSPNVLVEALFLKNKIISTNCPTGPKEILPKQKYGSLFKVGDYNELAKKIITVSKRKKINVEKKYFSKYDNYKICKEYLNYIKKIFHLV